MQESGKILESLNLEFRYIEHEPVLDYEAAYRVDQQFNLTGQESKCLFIKTKSGKYYSFITYEGVNFDRKFFKEILGEKTSIASREELKDIAGYEAGCAAPFPYPKEVGYIVDNRVFNFDKYICSAGIPTESFEMPTSNLKEVYKHVDNEVIYVDVD